MCRKSRLFACDTNKTHAIMILAITPATTDEINELIEYCTWTRASVNGQIGFLITSNKPGYADRSIFLPYFFFGTSGDMGYWADSSDPGSSDRSATLWINVYEDYFNSGYCYRHWQLPVRPVCP